VCGTQSIEDSPPKTVCRIQSAAFPSARHQIKSATNDKQPSKSHLFRPLLLSSFCRFPRISAPRPPADSRPNGRAPLPSFRPARMARLARKFGQNWKVGSPISGPFETRSLLQICLLAVENGQRERGPKRGKQTRRNWLKSVEQKGGSKVCTFPPLRAGKGEQQIERLA